MKYKSLILTCILICTLFVFSCQPRAATPTPDNTPQATATPLPPKPVVPYTPVPADMRSPVIIQQSPARGEALTPDGAIEVVFDKPMDQDAVNTAFSVQLAGETPVPVDGELIWTNAHTLSFKPDQALARESIYDVILTQDAVAESGEPLREPYIARFATAGYLKVSQVFPSPNTEDIETDSHITVMFNRPVVPLASLQEMETFPNPLSFEPAIQGKGAWLNTSIYIFTPDSALPGGVTYNAKVSAGLEDIAGAILAEDYAWSFSTVPPEVLWNEPPRHETLVDINTAVTVQFNQPIDPQSARQAFSLNSGSILKSVHDGEFTIISDTLVFTPSKALDFDTSYTVKLDAGLTSTAGGKGMPETYSWKFTSVPLPEIIATHPENQEKNVSPYTSFEIVFNTPIDIETVMPNISMTPPLSPTIVYTYFSHYDSTFTLYFGAEASTEYNVVIGDGIADPYGNTIPRGRSVKFTTAPLDPSYRLLVPDMIASYDASLPASMVMEHVNIGQINLRLYRLPGEALQQPYWDLQDQLPQGSDLLREWQLNLENTLNKKTYTSVSLTEEADGTLTPGLYYLDVDSPDIDSDRYEYNKSHVLVVSDLNLTLKVGPKEALVWAIDLATGQPVADLTLNFLEQHYGFIEHYGEGLGAATTNQEGIARISLDENHDDIVVYSQNPFAGVSKDWGRGINPWAFGVGDGLSGQKHRAYIYTDRPIYRPGQTMNFKGVIRAEDDAIFSLTNQQSVLVMIRDANYEEIYKEMLTLSDLGTFEGSLDLEDGAALGNYSIAVEFEEHYTEQSFQVSAYRAPEFEISVELSAEEIQRGDDIAALISADYFFGGSLAGTEIEWNVLAATHTFEPPWGGNYSFRDSDDPYTCFGCWWWNEPSSQEPILSGSATSDGNGEVALTLDGAAIAEALDKGAQRIIVEASAYGPDNQYISGRSSTIAHPGPYYVGLVAQSYVNTAGDESNIDLVVVDWEGTRLPNQEIKIEFYHREWINTFIENEFGGGYWEWDTKDTQVDEITVTSDAQGEAVATFIPAKGGAYRVVASAANPSAATENIRSATFVWVAGEDYISWRRENHDRITLISDKNTYQVGETAEILIPSPFEGPHTALVTIERQGIRRYEVLNLTSNSTIYQLPITNEDIPNIYLSVVLVQGRLDSGKLADFKMGLLPLDVDLTPKTLTLNIEASTEQAQPGEDVAYTITARDANGELVPNAEVSLDVVDKAVLSLLPRTQNILSGFYDRRALEMRTASSLSLSTNRYQEEDTEDLDITSAATTDDVVVYHLMAQTKNEIQVGNGDMAPPTSEATQEPSTAEQSFAPPPGVEVREEFADTAFWSPQLRTDAQGQASVVVTLPDNLTTWVVHGVGLSADTLVGENTSDLVATKPLLVRPVAPRFFVVDDRAQLAANVNNNTDAAMEVEVGLSAEGVSIDANTPALQTVTIPANSETKVTWDVVVNDVPQTQLIFSAVSDEYADASKPRLSTGPDGSLMVFRYTTPDIVGTAGQLTEGGSRTEGISLPPAFDDQRGALHVQLDPSLAAGMQDGLEYLEHYEYECTEQTVSRFLPNVLTYHALNSLNIENPELEARLPDLVAEGLGKLELQQNPDGGWGWWARGNDGDWESNPHVSAYVIFALLKTQDAHIEVSAEMLQRGIQYLKEQVDDVRGYTNYRHANQQAWLLYVLAEANELPQTKLDEVYENREKLSHYARAYLAQAIWLTNPNDARLQTLLSDLNNAAILSATGTHWEENNYDWWAMNTDTRSTAIILDTYAKLDPENALVPNVVRWLMVARKTGIWETTQETAWALISLTDWMLHTGELDANYDYGVFLNEVERGSASATRETIRENIKTSIPIADLLADSTNALSIARTEGPGRLYYTAHLEVYQPVESVEPADRGFVVQRRYTLASCEEENIRDCPEVREVRLGDVIRVDLTLITPHDRYYVVVEDPLPAGGEAIDTGLATTSLLAMDPTIKSDSRRFDRWGWWWHWYSRSELRDEKVVLFADYLSSGTYEYSYTFRATLPGDFHVLPSIAKEFYFPEVFGRSDGRLLTISE